jgi:threonine aldolase
VPSKMRFLSCQIIAGLEGNGWRRRAETANATAWRLAVQLLALPGVEIVRAVDANMIFVALPAPYRERFFAAGYVCEERPDLGPGVIRLLTNWSTTDRDIEQLIAALKG